MAVKWLTVLILGWILILSLVGPYPSSFAQLITGEEFKSKVMAEAEASKKTPDKAHLLIFSDDGWSATILDSGLDTTTQDGSLNSKIEFECVIGFMSTYSVSVQKDSESGFLFLALVQNGNLLDEVYTTAAYGIASLAGNCGEPEDLG